MIELRGQNDPKPTAIRDYVGQAYSHRQHLSDGHKTWKLKPLQGGRSETNLAPEDLRPIFMRVVMDCVAPTAGSDALQIDVACMLVLATQARRVLIACPLRVVPVWLTQFERHVGVDLGDRGPR